MAGKLPGRALDPTTTITINNISFGDNVAVNSSVIVLGNSTVNTVVNSTSVVTPSVNVGSNVFVNTSTIHLGNSTVNTVIHTTGFTGNGAGLHSVNAAALEGNTVANILTSANTAANTLAAAAFTNAVSFANNTFLPLTGGTLAGALTINATANIVSNLAANNVTFRGDVQIDGNLVVSGTSVTLNAASLAVEDNMIYLNNGSQVTHPDLGFAGNYNDGTYKHAGFFRDATDGVWKVYDGYTPEPDASAFIDTSNASFRIADFQANAITMASASLTGTLTVKAISSNGSVGTAGQLLASNGTSTYWINPPASTNVDAQYTWTNTHTFANTITFGNSTVNSTISSTTFKVGGNTSTFGTAAYIVANGNIGIGTASPAYKLEVNGILGVEQGSYIRKAFLDNTEEFLIRGDAGVWNGFISYTPSSGSVNRGFKFGAWDNGGGRQDWVTIWDSNVGIGNTTPASKLTVSTNSSNSGYQTALNFASVGLQIESANAQGQGVVAFTFGGTVRSTVRGDYTGNLVLSPKSGDIYFGYDASGANTVNHRFYSNSTNMAVLFAANGNVGVGTNSPTNKLEISGTLNQTGAYGTIGGYNSGGQDTPFGRSGPTFGTNITNGQAEVNIWNPFDPVTYTSTGILLSQALSATTRRDLMFLKHDGSIGVGNISPWRRLDITGGGIAFTDSAGANRTIHWGDRDTGIFPVVITGDARSGYGTLSLCTATFGNSALPRVIIDSAGRTMFNTSTANTTANTVMTVKAFTSNTGNFSFEFRDSNDTLRSTITDRGAQNWYIMAGDGLEKGSIRYSTPGGFVGILYFDSAGLSRSDFRHVANGGFTWHAHSLGTVPPELMRMDNAGNLTIVGTLTESSSITLKENLDPIQDALGAITSLTGYVYDRKDGTAKRRAGLIAEEVESILPNVVKKDSDGNPTGIQYTNLIAYLVESIKELKAEIDILKGR